MPASFHVLGAGLWSIPVPIPDNPLGHTLVYVLETDRGPVLVDAGWNDPATLRALTEGLTRIGTSIDDVYGLLVTHHHPDHHGLAGAVRDRSGCWIALHELDADVVSLVRTAERGPWLERYRELLRMAGAPESEVEALPDELSPSAEPPAEPDRRITDGELLDVPGRKVRAVWTPGHSPGHTCFHLEETGELLSGDHLLPEITPTVGIYEHLGADHDPLGEYLASLQKIIELAPTRALPAHQYAFEDASGRAVEILAHHERRLIQVEVLIANGAQTLWQIAEGMEWNRPWSELSPLNKHIALGEAASHLRRLKVLGRA